MDVMECVNWNCIEFYRVFGNF